MKAAHQHTVCLTGSKRLIFEWWQIFMAQAMTSSESHQTGQLRLAWSAAQTASRFRAQVVLCGLGDNRMLLLLMASLHTCHLDGC